MDGSHLSTLILLPIGKGQRVFCPVAVIIALLWIVLDIDGHDALILPIEYFLALLRNFITSILFVLIHGTDTRGLIHQGSPT